MAKRISDDRFFIIIKPVNGLALERFKRLPVSKVEKLNASRKDRQNAILSTYLTVLMPLWIVRPLWYFVTRRPERS